VVVLEAVGAILGLVVLATAVAASAKWLRVPAPSLLVVAGIVVGMLPGVPAVHVSPDAIALVVLPPLLYAAGEELSGRELRQVWRPVAVLAVGLVLATAGAVGFVAATIIPLDATTAFLLGSVLASTDPVAVTALGRRLPLPPRVHTLVQAESLFNDATSLVLFRIAVAIVVAGGALSWNSVAVDFVVLALGGATAGLVVAVGVALIRRRTEDPILETVITLVTPYTAYVLAESAHASGVTAVVVASITLGSLAPRLTTPRIRLQLHAVYGTVTFLLESVVFSLIGLQLPTLIRTLSAADEHWLLPALAIAGTLIITRIIWVFPLTALAQGFRGGRSAWRVAAVVSWAGTRGVLPLAAALSIPLTTASGAPLPYRDLLLVLATVVIVISLIVQGLTLGPLVRYSGITEHPDAEHREYALARQATTNMALSHLDRLEEAEGLPTVVLDQMRQRLQARADRLEDAPETDDLTEAYLRLRRDLLAVESTELARLYEVGMIGTTIHRRLQHQLDLEEASLED
jgi:CPA1 family monovalent cation:H+ antiporter